MFISRLDAVNEFVLTAPVGVIKTPFGFISKTFPFELSCPAIFDGVEPVTLFKEEELEVGILKSTRPCGLIEKLFQLMIDFEVA